MNRKAGFTLIELMIVIAILGILSATAMPVYHTYKQRAYGAEASLMVKRILDQEIAYFLEHDKFFPEDGQAISIFSDDSPSKDEIQQIKNALNITIPVGHFLYYYLQTFPATADDFCTIIISAPFPLYRDGTSQILGIVNKYGMVTISSEEKVVVVEEEEVEEEEVKAKKVKKVKEPKKMKKPKKE